MGGPEAAVLHAPPSIESEKPLREAILEGRFFGPGYRDVAVQLSGFLHGDAAPAGWFGDTFPAHTCRDIVLAALTRDIAAIDELIAEQLDAVLHAPKLQTLEGRWRGLHWLVSGTEPNRRLKVKVQQATWAELSRDLERALEFDQSILFRRVYEEEFGTAGGEPIGLMVIDHAVRHRRTAAEPTDDVGILRLLSAVAAAAFVPTVLGLHPSVLDVDDFSELGAIADIAEPFRRSEHTAWRSLVRRPDTRFLALTLPRVLARHPWADDPGRRDGFRYREYAPTAAERTWMSAAYPFAACVVRAFANHGWPADVRGVETDRVGGGLVTDLPPEPFASGPAQAWTRVSLDYRLTDRQEQALVDAGLLPLTALPYGPDLVFGSAHSLQSPGTYQGATAAAAGANARLSSQVNSILCASRFAHLLKVMGRDMVGSLQTADQIERHLQAWLQKYVNTNFASTGDSRARFPLVDGDVQVREQPGKPGTFSCIMRLQPHHQLDDVASTFSLVTELAQPGRS